MSHILLRSAEQLPHDDRNRLQEQMSNLARLSRSLEAEHARSTHITTTVEECSRLTHALEDILNEVNESASEDEREQKLWRAHELVGELFVRKHQLEQLPTELPMMTKTNDTIRRYDLLKEELKHRGPTTSELPSEEVESNQALLEVDIVKEESRGAATALIRTGPELLRFLATVRRPTATRSREVTEDVAAQHEHQQRVEKVRKELDELSRDAEQALIALQSIDVSVEQLPSTVAEVAALHKDIELVIAQLQTKLSISDRVKKELAEVSSILEESTEAPPAGEASTKKKRKGRKKGQKDEPQQPSLSRQEQLAQLHNTALRLKGDVLEKLLLLESELKQADIPHEQASIAREKTEENLRKIQENISEKENEQKNADAVIRDVIALEDVLSQAESLAEPEPSTADVDAIQSRIPSIADAAEQ